MGWLSNALKKIKKSFGSKGVGSSETECPLKETGLLVVVVQKHNRETLAGAVVGIEGKSPSHKQSDKDGLALFKPLEPGAYKISVDLPSALKENYEEVEVTEEVVSLGSCPVHVTHVHPFAELKVKLVQLADRNKVIGGATVEISGDNSYPAKTSLDSDGTADFGKVRVGKYNLKVTLKRDDAESFATPTPQEIELSVKQKLGLVVKVANNVVTPKIELEYKTVLLERNLAQYQEGNEEKIYADPTYIELYLAQKNKSYPFTKGAKLTCSGASVEAYLDEACQNLLAGDLGAGIALTHEQLKDEKRLRLYLRGKVAGPFDLTLEVDDPEDPAIKREETAKEKMGVVELKATLHQQDQAELKNIKTDPDTDPVEAYYINLKDRELPAQKAMSDEAKIKLGRLLHCQNKANFSRAKFVVNKLDASHWPDGSGDYEIYINRTGTGSDLALYETEWDGAPKKFPLKIKLSDLKSADQTFWIEGKSVSDKRLDVRLDLTLDRPDGGLAKEVKRNGDWSRFTVIEIKEVKVEYQPKRGTSIRWDRSVNRFHINQAATWDATTKKFTTDADTELDGRKIIIGAQLSKAFKDVTVHFMLAPDENNRKTANWGEDIPAIWRWKDVDKHVKHLDKADRKDLLHLSAKTDATGYAKVELTLSRFGGDIFWPACYISEDPHLAKYVDGFAGLEKRVPTMTENSVTVWRKFWYQEVKVTGIDVAGFGDSAETYEDVKADMIAAPVVEMPRATADAIATPVIYPKHMVSFYLNNARTAYINNYPGDTDDALVVGDATESTFFNLAKPASDRPVMIPILNAHALWVADGTTSSAAIPWFSAADFPLDFSADKKLLDPPLQGGDLLISGDWESMDWDAAANGGAGDWVNPQSGALQAADIELDPNRSSPRAVQIKKPAALVVIAATEVTITNLTLRGGVTYLGTSYDDGIVNSYTPNDEQDFINTINHEIGHSLKQVTKIRPAGIPAHPHQYDQSGSHCNYTNKSCLMYESGPQAASLNRYCPVCHPYVLVQDMSKV
ncbi:MAG: hypothetical protein L3J28_04590 [Candidatus Polarisedimenticolaceae bacterium]|nr:hypothetical protein [Candidatus Polarisedimenticolaceae bacterium]